MSESARVLFYSFCCACVCALVNSFRIASKHAAAAMAAKCELRAARRIGSRLNVINSRVRFPSHNTLRVSQQIKCAHRARHSAYIYIYSHFRTQNEKEKEIKRAGADWRWCISVFTTTTNEPVFRRAYFEQKIKRKIVNHFWMDYDKLA